MVVKEQLFLKLKEEMEVRGRLQTTQWVISQILGMELRGQLKKHEIPPHGEILVRASGDYGIKDTIKFRINFNRCDIFDLIQEICYIKLKIEEVLSLDKESKFSIGNKNIYPSLKDVL